MVTRSCQLEKTIGLQSQPSEHTDLDFPVGSWEEDPTFDAAVADFEQLGRQSQGSFAIRQPLFFL